MATTTTNFGWDIPQSTDLVKDGATAIAALGQDIDTAFVDFKGGTTGQVLKKTSGTDLDVEWGTASSGGLTLINTTSFSGVSSHSLAQDTFTSTYTNYKIIYSEITTTSQVDLTLRLRKAGTDNTDANYKRFGYVSSSASIVNAYEANWSVLRDSHTTKNYFAIDLYAPQLNQPTYAFCHYADTVNTRAFVQSLQHTTSDVFDSVTLTGGTMTGTVSVYGLAK
jgi:hypothetical protein